MTDKNDPPEPEASNSDEPDIDEGFHDIKRTKSTVTILDEPIIINDTNIKKRQPLLIVEPADKESLIIGDGIVKRQRSTTSIMSSYDRSKDEPGLSCKERVKLFCKIYWRSIALILVPLLLCPVFALRNTKAYRCLYLYIVISIFWCFTILPLSVTAMIPIVFFPIMGIMDSTKTCASYMHESTLMFLGSMMVALGIEQSMLPKRLAIGFIKIVGCSHLKLIYSLSFMAMFLSMWITNIAVTSIMAPIIMNVLEVLQDSGMVDIARKRLSDTPSWLPRRMTALLFGELDDDEETQEEIGPSDTTICYFLMVVYSTSIGGMGTLIGTPSNLSYKGILESRFTNAPPVDFLMFMFVAVPPMLLIHSFTYIFMICYFMDVLRCNPENNLTYMNKTQIHLMNTVIDNQYIDLGSPTFFEKAAGVFLILTPVLFFTRSPGFMTGWADVIAEEGFVRDSFGSISVVLLMFILPIAIEFTDFCNCNKGRSELPTEAKRGMLTWSLLQEKIYWELIFLIGGGFALTTACRESGMSAMIIDWFKILENQPHSIIIVVLIIIVEIFTEFVSNIAVANITLPLVAEMAVATQCHPVMLMLPVALTCSLSFQKSEGTVTNALIASYSQIPKVTMFKAGFGPTLISAFFVIIGSVFYTPHIHAVDSFPAWAAQT